MPHPFMMQVKYRTVRGDDMDYENLIASLRTAVALVLGIREMAGERSAVVVAAAVGSAGDPGQPPGPEARSLQEASDSLSEAVTSLSLALDDLATARRAAAAAGQPTEGPAVLTEGAFEAEAPRLLEWHRERG